jgi:16S rRNA (guanine966-N2)-methyltransferase
MRVVGGEWRGRRLAAPAGRATRPTSDKVREAIFDMLASLLDRSFDGLEVADLFAGSGALGIEALSRGAARCTFVEQDRAAVAALRANLEALHVHRERARVVARSVSAALVADAREARRYTLLLADPPYAAWPVAQADLAEAVEQVLAPGGLVVVETARGASVQLPLRALRVKQYGDTQVTVLVRDGSSTANEEVSCPAK